MSIGVKLSCIATSCCCARPRPHFPWSQLRSVLHRPTTRDCRLDHEGTVTPVKNQVQFLNEFVVFAKLLCEDRCAVLDNINLHSSLVAKERELVKLLCDEDSCAGLMNQFNFHSALVANELSSPNCCAKTVRLCWTGSTFHRFVSRMSCKQYTSHVTFFSCLCALVMLCHTTLAQVFVRVISSMCHAPE